VKPGDQVHVASLGKGIVREIRNGGRCLVEIKGRSLLVAHQQLSPIEIRKTRPKRGAPEAPACPDPMPGLGATASIDLHGMTTDEAVAALEMFLNDAILAGHPRVRVIHGRSGGRLKTAVHGRLKGISSVAHYRVDPSNPGVTVVAF
jgi:DNA mismatch repair protein MutS2